VRDNVYGTIEQDAKRRDFTINALYYDVESGKLLDFFHGFADIVQKKLRIIGDPAARYREDPVRMLRAARFAGKLDFRLTTESEQPIYKLACLLHDVSPARLFDEVFKLFHMGDSSNIFPLMDRLGLFKVLFPLTAKSLQRNPHETREFIEQLLKGTDQRIKQEKHIMPAFLFVVLLWFPLCECYAKLKQKGDLKINAFDMAMRDVIHEQSQTITLSWRITATMKDVWLLQLRLERRHPRYIMRLFRQKRFRAAYDLLLLRAKSGKNLKAVADWWTRFQEATKSEREAMISQLKNCPN
jgi:poly(A) polymerase